MPDIPKEAACVFCAILAGEAPATVVRSWSYAVAIAPLNPVTEGHTLVIPATHVRDVAEDPEVSALTMQAAAELSADVGPCNIITSKGAEATQTVPHLHLHVVPRRAGDGLALPWTAQHSRKPRTTCPVCGKDVVQRDNGKPIVHYAKNNNPQFTCKGDMFSHCRGGRRCPKHR